MKTAKLLALCLCLPLCLTACTQAEPSESSSESSSVSSSSESSQSQSKEEPYKITLTDELVRANNANARNGGYIMEEERYIVYCNPADNDKLYRYEKGTGEVKVIYNDNVTQIHSIKFFDNKIYFVTRAVTDEVPTLYSVDIEGKNLEQVIEGVGDDYIVTSDTIYYTSYRESNGAIFYLYRFDRKSEKSTLMRPGQCEYLNLVGDEIYFVDYTFTGESETSGSGVICKINVKTNEFETVSVYDEQGREVHYIERLFYVDNILYFTARVGTFGNSFFAFLSYDLNKGAVETIATISDFDKTTGINQITFCPFIVLNNDHFYFCLNGVNGCAVVELKNNQMNVQWKRGAGQGGLLYIVENKPITYEPSQGLIIGAEKLMVKAGEA